MIAEAELLVPTVRNSETARLTDTRDIFALSSGTAEMFARAADVPADLWAAAFGEDLKDFEYYRLIEETMTDHFAYRYVLLRGSENEVVALQPLIIVNQDLAAAVRGALLRVVEGIRRIAPRFLRTRMLMAGCLVGDGTLGVMPATDMRQAAGLLGEALVRLAKRERISLITVKDFPADLRSQLEPLARAGYCRMPSFPPMKLALNFGSFDEYLEKRLSRITRKGLRRKLRKAASTPVHMEVINDCRDVIDEIYPLYLEVARRSDVKFETFTKDYFVEAGRRMPERARFFIWRRDGKAVAFSFCIVWRGAIYDNDIGLDYSVAHELNLYYVTFRDLLEWGLAHGLTSYYSAPFNYDPKLHLRMTAVPVDIYVRHTARLRNAALRLFAPSFAPAKSDPALRRHLGL